MTRRPLNPGRTRGLDDPSDDPPTEFHNGRSRTPLPTYLGLERGPEGHESGEGKSGPEGPRRGYFSLEGEVRVPSGSKPDNGRNSGGHPNGQGWVLRPEFHGGPPTFLSSPGGRETSFDRSFGTGPDTRNEGYPSRPSEPEKIDRGSCG